MSELAGPFKMALPFFSQHLRVLEDCGRVRSHKEGRGRTYRLEPRRLKAAEGWMVKQRAVWERRLDPLDAYLGEIAHSGTESPTRLGRWTFGPCTRAGVSPQGGSSSLSSRREHRSGGPVSGPSWPLAPSLPSTGPLSHRYVEEVRYWMPEDGRPDRVGTYSSVSGRRIDSAKVGDAKVFRTGVHVALLVSEETNQALERIGATGTKFKEV